ncbi:protein DMP10-like [Rosa rugosa]|uniref:protein DMP10-like n=1 Tax=Rosa rugosa TaxID=74645 RepID=UPI002B40B611|nr:protein DMP10-like [Rosa rugosa]
MSTEKPETVAPAPIPKTISSTANLANLLPTGTVLAFQTLIPSFSNNGSCHPSNKGLTISIIVICALLCFFSSFTDSFIDSTDGKFYYGIATSEGMYILNSTSEDTKQRRRRLKGYRRMPVDHFHAFMSLTLFLIYALTNLNVKDCFFPKAGDNLSQVIINLPLGAGIFACLLFTIFPTTRRGIGFTLLRPEKVKEAEGQASTTTTTPQGLTPKKEVVVEIEADAQPLAGHNHSRGRSY